MVKIHALITKFYALEFSELHYYHDVKALNRKNLWIPEFFRIYGIIYVAQRKRRYFRVRVKMNLRGQRVEANVEFFDYV